MGTDDHTRTNARHHERWSARLLERLSRVSSLGRLIPELEGLRFAAILLVVLYHFNYFAGVYGRPFAIDAGGPWYARLVRHGHYGVELFFVISGFILALPFASHHLKGAPRVSLRRYFLRRLTRLEPPYVLVMVVLFVGLAWLNIASAGTLLPHLAAGLVYGHNLLFGAINIINPVAWSLEIEVQFYLLVPLLTRVFAVRHALVRRSTIGGLVLALPVAQLAFVPERGRLFFTILNHLQFFLVGFLLADLYLTRWSQRGARVKRWDVVGLVGAALVVVVWEHPAWSRLLFPFLLFWICAAAFRGVLLKRVLTNRWLMTIGGMCYTLYLIHYELVRLAVKHSARLGTTGLPAVDGALVLLAAAAILLAAGALYFVLIERPCMREGWPVRLAQRVQRARLGRYAVKWLS